MAEKLINIRFRATKANDDYMYRAVSPAVFKKSYLPAGWEALDYEDGTPYDGDRFDKSATPDAFPVVKAADPTPDGDPALADNDKRSRNRDNQATDQASGSKADGK